MGHEQKQVPFWGDTRDPRVSTKWNNHALHWLVLFGVLAFSWIVLSRMGINLFLGVLVGAVFGSIYAVISFKTLPIPFAVWLLSIGGFSAIWSIQTPGLPDLYLDRLALIWLSLVFGLKFIISGQKLRLPVVLDWVILAHGLYLLVSVILGDMEFFGMWVSSSLIPISAYFLSKNIIIETKWVRRVLLWLLILSIYYNITSVAEKFRIEWLIWPKYMLEQHEEFIGRSNGPFRQAPLFGTIIGMLLPVHLYFIHTTRSIFVKVLLFISLAIGFGGLYFTYTRGSWLAGLVALGVAVVLNRKQYWKSMAPLLILVPFLAVSFLGLQQDKFMKDRLDEESTIDARVGVVVTSLRMWRDNPILGIGFFKFKERREDYVQAVDVPGFGSIKFAYFRKTSLHDIYLGPLAEVGIVGTGLQFTTYLLILRLFLMKFGLARERRHFQRFILPLFAGIFLGYLVGGLVIDYRYFSFIGALFFACAGMLAGYDPKDDRDELVE